MTSESRFTDIDLLILAVLRNNFESFQRTYNSKLFIGYNEYQDILTATDSQNTRFFVHVLENNPIYSNSNDKGAKIAIGTVIWKNNLPCLEVLISRGVPKEVFRQVLEKVNDKPNNEVCQRIRKYIE